MVVEIYVVSSIKNVNHWLVQIKETFNLFICSAIYTCKSRIPRVAFLKSKREFWALRRKKWCTLQMSIFKVKNGWTSSQFKKEFFLLLRETKIVCKILCIFISINRNILIRWCVVITVLLFFNLCNKLAILFRYFEMLV